jgi:hypothetical protein
MYIAFGTEDAVRSESLAKIYVYLWYQILPENALKLILRFSCIEGVTG